MSLLQRIRAHALPEASAPEASAKSQTIARYNTRTGWEAFGIPSDAGDGFAYNAEGKLLTASSMITSERAILQLSTAMACVRLLATTIATLPIGIYERMPDGSRKEATGHPLYAILKTQPNARMTAVDFWQIVLAWMLLRGTAYCEKDMIGSKLVALDPLQPACLTWRKLEGGSRLYTYRDPRTGKSRDIPQERMWKLPAFTLDGDEGLSPIAYGANVFGAATAADQASSGVFANGMAAAGFVTTQPNQWLTKDQRDKIRAHLREYSWTGARHGESFVLEGGMGYTKLGMNPEDAQMLETRSFNIEEICRWFGVPPTLVGHGDKTSNWGTGLEQQNQSFLTYSLRPWLSKTEQSILSNLFTAADKTRYYAEFNVEGLLRADSTGRASFYSSGLQNGWINRETVARRENLPIPKGGEIYTVSAALVPLDSIEARAAATMPKQDEPKSAIADPASAAGESSVQATALNGAQVTSLQGLLQAAADGTMPLSTVRATIAAAFPLLTAAEIDAMIVPLEGFVPTAPTDTPAPPVTEVTP
ncbi:phage portal protein [Dokdonella sp. MW10]|uniref:phage portal protein n=1 Tax=Dokdonella sp. MW10 TaxID=2992926 RepID=UPI003F815917